MRNNIIMIIIGSFSILAFLGCEPLIRGTIVKAEAISFRVGFFNLVPHAIIGKKTDHTGAAIEYFKLIAKKMRLSNVTFESSPLARLLHKLEKGEIDVALLLGKNPERASKFIYPKAPFFNMQPAIAVASSHRLKKIESIQDIIPMKIGAWAKGYHSPMIRDKRLQIKPLHGDNVIVQSFERILVGRVDAFYSPDAYSLKFEAKGSNYLKDIRILLLPEPSVGLYSVFSKQSAKKYKVLYEKSLNELQNEQTYDVFLNNSIKNK